MRLHSAHSSTPLEITGTFFLSGPQDVGRNGVPRVVAKVFFAMPHVDQVALVTESGGVVYSRIGEPGKAPSEFHILEDKEPTP